MSVSVLMYHHVLPGEGFLAISERQFRAQMAWLAEKGYRTLTAAQFLAFKRGEWRPPRRSVVLTFDDGWRDNHVFAAPILREYGLRAVLFVVTGWTEAASAAPAAFKPLDHRGCKSRLAEAPGAVVCSWDELAEMRDVFDIHSHTHTHREHHFGALSWEEDLARSRALIEQRLGETAPQLCWPRGRYDERSKAAALAAGYRALYTTRRGINRPDGDTAEIRRLAVKHSTHWLAKSLFLFSNDPLGRLYARLKPE